MRMSKRVKEGVRIERGKTGENRKEEPQRDK